MHLDGDAGDSGKCTRSSDHALIADQYVRLPHKNNQRARIAELRTRTLARAPNRAREARSGRWRTTERPSTHSTHSNTLDLRRKARAWCFLELCRNPTTTTPHAQGASGYTKLVRRRALYRALGDLPGNAGRWLLGRSPLRSRCEVVRGKHWRNSNLHSGPRFAKKQKTYTPCRGASAPAARARSRSAMADPIIDGTHSSPALLHQSLVDAAGAYLERLHLAPCTDETPILFYRMDFHGIGNDLTRATAALAAAVIKRRQLVLLPPLRRLHAKVPSLRHTNWQQPWHWLVRGPTGLRLESGHSLLIAACALHVPRPVRGCPTTTCWSHRTASAT